MSAIDRVTEYYRRVDQQDNEWVIELFSPDSVYERAGMKYEGKAAIAKFYREERRIRGQHSLHTLYRDGEALIVEGEFVGTGADNSPKKVSFCDIWTMRGEYVARRQTFLAMGSEYVKE